MERDEISGGTGATESPLTRAALAGALEAARALEWACRESSEAQNGERRLLYLGSVADLARDLGEDLSSLAGNPAVSSSSVVVSAALRAADLATLAACALPELQPRSPEFYRVAAAAHTASGAARSLALEHPTLAAALSAGNDEDYAAHDLRGAAWRASLAARQTDEALQTED